LVKEIVPPLRLTPEKSTALLSFILSAHISAAGVVLLLPLEFWLQLIVLFGIAVSLIQGISTHVIYSRGSAIRSAEWDSEGEWRLRTVSGNELTAQLKSSSNVQTWFVILNFSISPFQRHSLILLPDAVDPDLLRRLRVRLKLIGGTDATV